MSRPPKPSLAAIVAASAGPGRGAEAVAPAARPATLKARARQMSVYLEPPVYDQLRDLAHVERTKMHALMLEALDLLFRQRGSPSIAHLTQASAPRPDVDAKDALG
ncbi:ribbon-helix-helix domain-containing protein [Methylobacterium sp. Leaf108]|uniref:ribbon-helix-helix domain-containing protein n=1 Tax=Methylobacterium sp. Leaf108 TaxID=1736256 RepID=UPI0006F9EB5C|nr:ribbon-helix-helix domain-containing protein [Methylobacterium sp. Leaf108]KQP48961.1 hypothetical protein ASF39_14510 [Methylobacterium sp. Leaf108]